MHVDDFWKAFNTFRETVDGAVDDTDNGGQIIIYTGLMWGQNDDVIPYEEDK